jgi:membrane protease YdiL (CAAX protease family)
MKKLKTPIVIILWGALFGFIVQIGPSAFVFGKFFTEPWATLWAAVFNLAWLAPLFALHRAPNQKLFARTRTAPWLYLALVILGAAVPFHYHMSLPAGVYLFFMTVSVFSQDYITFGLLQTYLRDTMPAPVATALITVLFTAVHLLYLPHFRTQWGMVLLVAAMAAVFSALREKTKSIHWVIFIHLAFYFIFC